MIERLASSPVVARLAAGTLWSLVGSLSGRLLTLAGMVIAARVLGKVGFGELGIVQSTVLMCAVLAEFGIGLTASKYVPELRHEDPPRAGRIIALLTLVSMLSGVLAASMLVAFSSDLAARVLAAPQLAHVLALAALILAPGVLEGALRAALVGFEAFKAVAFTTFVAGVASFPLLVGGTILGGLRGAVLGLAAARLVGVLVTLIALYRAAGRAGVVLDFRHCAREWQVFGSFGVPALLSAVMVGPVAWACNAILVNTEFGYAEMALLSAALPWRGLLMFVPALVVRVSLPILSSVQASDQHGAEYRNAIRSILGTTVALVFPAGVLIMYLSSWVMKLYGAEYAQGEVVLVLIAASVMLMGVGCFAGPVIQARGKMWIAFGFNLCWVAVLVAITWWLAPQIGAAAVALGHCIAYLLLTVVHLWYLRRDLSRDVLARAFGAVVWVLGVAGLCLLASPAVRVALALPVLSSAFFGAYLLLRSVSESGSARQ